MDFITQILPWLLSGIGLGSIIGSFIEHRFSLKREREGWAFEAKKEVYGKLSNAIHDFSFNVLRAARVDDIWKVMEHLKDLSKASAYAGLYANKSVAEILDELNTCAADYTTVIEESIKAYGTTPDVDPMSRQAKEKHAKITAKFSDVKNRLIAEMKKDLGIK